MYKQKCAQKGKRTESDTDMTHIYKCRRKGCKMPCACDELYCDDCIIVMMGNDEPIEWDDEQWVVYQLHNFLNTPNKEDGSLT